MDATKCAKITDMCCCKGLRLLVVQSTVQVEQIEEEVAGHGHCQAEREARSREA